MKQNKHKSSLLSNAILAVVSVFTGILMLAAILIAINFNKDKEKLVSLQETKSSLEQKLDNLAPNRITLPTGRFPLEANEKLLDKAYLRLMGFIYQKSDSKKEFESNKDTLVQYFSLNGYNELKKETLLKNGKQVKSLSNKLEYCRVAFSDFNLNKKTINITIYSNYQLASPSKNNKTGVSVVTLTYNFNDLSVTNFDIRSATVDNQKVF